MRSLAELLWWHLPRAIAARFPALGQMLGDGGGWLRAWPTIAVPAPAGSLVLGLVIGLTHAPSAEIFADNIPLFAVLTAVSLLGGGLGASAWLGYVIGDLVFVRYWLQPNLVDHLVRERSGQLIVFLVLWIGVVGLPYVITQLRRQTIDSLPSRLRSPIAEMATQAAIGAFVVAGWISLLPVAVAPFYLWRGYNGPAQTIVDLRTNWWLFVAIAIAVGASRVALERVAARRDPSIPINWSIRLPPSPGRQLLTIVGGAALGALLLAGMLQTWLEAAAVVGGLVLAGVLRAYVMPRLGALVALVTRIPVIIRLLIVAGTGFLITSLTVPAQQGVITTESYVGLLIPIITSLVVAAVLLPPPPSDADFSPPVAVPSALPELLRTVGPLALVAILWRFVDPSVAVADDCSGAFDCLTTLSAGQLVAAAAAGLGGLWWAGHQAQARHQQQERDRQAKEGRDAAAGSATDSNYNRGTITEKDGSRLEVDRRGNGTIEARQYGPPPPGPGGQSDPSQRGPLIDRTVYSPDKSEHTKYGPDGKEIESSMTTPDGGTATRTAKAGGGYTATVWDANGNVVATGDINPDGTWSESKPSPNVESGTTTDTYKDGVRVSHSVNTPDGSNRTWFWDPPPPP